MKKFWINLVEGKVNPEVPQAHDNKQEALKEAGRLALLDDNLGKIVWVMESITSCCVEKQTKWDGDMPAPEKKPRKERKDKGTKKGVSLTAEQLQAGIKNWQASDSEVTEEPKLEIHGPDEKGIFTAQFQDKKTWGPKLNVAVKTLKKDCGGEWPESMSKLDKNLADGIIAGGGTRHAQKE